MNHRPPTSPETPKFRQLLSYARPHAAALSAGLVLNAFAAILTLVQPLVAKGFLDGLADGRPVAGLVLFLAVLLLLATAAAAFGYYLVDRSAERVVHGIRTTMVGRIIRLRQPVIDRSSPGDLLSRVVSDSSQLRAATTSNLVDLSIGSFQVVGIILLMAYLDLPLLLVVAGVVVVIGGTYTLLLPRIRVASLRVQTALGEMSGALERTLAALRTIKASGAEARETAAVNQSTDQALREGVRAARWVAVGGISTGLIVQVSFLIVLGYGGARAASGVLEISSLIAFLLFLFYLSGPIGQLVSSISGLQTGLAALGRIREIEVLEVERTEAAAGPVQPSRTSQSPTGRAGAAVVFEDVRFGYSEDEPLIFEGLDFEAPGVGMTAIVGPSGAGKSTVFSLIEGFYEASSGRIRIDGRDIASWPLDELRQRIGYVEQDAPVLSGTLRENLMLAAPDSTDTDLEDIISRARLEGLVGRLEHGMDTHLGHHGVTLSGGERQRIAIARALLRRPRLLLLDEATSQLDSINEQAIQEIIAETASTTAVLVIAHRMSTVRRAERILVFERGRVRAQGTHGELMSSDILYQELSLHQSPAGSGRSADAPHPGAATATMNR